MSKKSFKPHFLVSAQLHSKIATSCIRIDNTDSCVLNVRPAKHGAKEKGEHRTDDNDLAYYYVAH